MPKGDNHHHMDIELRKTLTDLNNVIKNFLTQFDLDCKLGTDFGYYWESEVVEYAIIVTERFDKLFTEYLNAHYSDVTAPLFIWSLLHEVGHSETDDYFNTEAHCVFDEFKQSLDPDKDSDVMEYYNCPDEVLATKWAYLYIRDNAPKVEALWNEIYPLLKKISLYVD